MYEKKLIIKIYVSYVIGHNTNIILGKIMASFFFVLHEEVSYIFHNNIYMTKT